MSNQPQRNRRASTAAVLLLAAVAFPTCAAEPRASDRGLTDTSASPHVPMRSVNLDDIRWTRGFWADRFETCRKESIPHLQRIMMGTEYSQYYHNFLIAAGR